MVTTFMYDWMLSRCLQPSGPIRTWLRASHGTDVTNRTRSGREFKVAVRFTYQLWREHVSSGAHLARGSQLRECSYTHLKIHAENEIQWQNPCRNENSEFFFERMKIQAKFQKEWNSTLNSRKNENSCQIFSGNEKFSENFVKNRELKQKIVWKCRKFAILNW